MFFFLGIAGLLYIFGKSTLLVGELIFNMLVLVGSVKMADRIVRK